MLEISALRKDREDLDVVETSLDGAKLSETISFSQLVKGGSLITKTRDAGDASSSLASSRDSFWGSITRKAEPIPARESDHAESANFSPTEVPIHHDIEERGPHHIVATPAPRDAVRDHPMLRAHRDVPAPSSSFPVWAMLVALAAFLLGRGSKRRRANGGKRGSRVV